MIINFTLSLATSPRRLISVIILEKTSGPLLKQFCNWRAFDKSLDCNKVSKAVKVVLTSAEAAERRTRKEFKSTLKMIHEFNIHECKKKALNIASAIPINDSGANDIRHEIENFTQR